MGTTVTVSRDGPREGTRLRRLIPQCATYPAAGADSNTCGREAAALVSLRAQALAAEPSRPTEPDWFPPQEYRDAGRCWRTADGRTSGRAAPSGSRRTGRRDRRGRGLRGPLAPAQVPLSRTRAEQFDEVVDSAVARLERRWSQELAAVEFAVAEVPPADLPDWAGELGAVGVVVPGRSRPRYATGSGHRDLAARRSTLGTGPLPPRIVLYRRPLEARASDRRELEALVLDVLVEQVADLLGLEPEAVDPDYGFFDD